MPMVMHLGSVTHAKAERIEIECPTLPVSPSLTLWREQLNAAYHLGGNKGKVPAPLPRAGLVGHGPGL